MEMVRASRECYNGSKMARAHGRKADRHPPLRLFRRSVELGMIDGWIIVALSFLYIGGLFGVAYWGDRAGQRKTSLTGRPYVYALALGVYCTSWTFFGSVGSAAAKGLDFIAVYLGPIAAFALAAPLLRRIVLLTKTQNITSIADFIAARYGKNPAVAAIVTVVAVVGLLPYIALQLKAVSQSIELIFGYPAQGTGMLRFLPVDMALLIALILAAFAILFGARQTDATEHQRGLMLAIAAESVVKLAAFLAVGAGIVFFMFGGIGPLMAQAAARPEITRLFENGIHGGTLLTVTWLSFVCIFLLPRQFHATFVENVSEEELKKAFWLFPVYLVAINIFVVPVAIAGILRFSGTDVPPDMYLLALPFYSGNHILTFLAFLGGLSAATAMVVMETVALSIMVCNDLLLPLILKRHTAGAEGSGDMSRLLLNIRRASILAIILLAYGLYDSIEKTSLAEIGLLSFAAIAQFAPAFFLGFVWRRATARGALAAILAGFAVWAYTLLLPKLIAGFPDGAAFLKQGPFGLSVPAAGDAVLSPLRPFDPWRRLEPVRERPGLGHGVAPAAAGADRKASNQYFRRGCPLAAGSARVQAVAHADSHERADLDRLALSGRREGGALFRGLYGHARDGPQGACAWGHARAEVHRKPAGERNRGAVLAPRHVLDAAAPQRRPRVGAEAPR